MACKLAPDATGAFDFTAGVGASATIFVESTPAGVKMSAADVAGTDCPVGADGKIKTPALTAGLSVLSITTSVVQHGDQVRVKEDCGDGTSHLLKTFVFDGEILKRYQINVF